MNYKKDLEIDMFALEDEWVKQSLIFMKYAELYANSIREKDKIKERLDVKKAELDADIRNDPDRYSISKITESTVANAIQSQNVFIELTKEYNDAVERMHIFSGAKSAMDHKKSALENLTKLHLQGYFSEPQIPQTLKDGAREGRRKQESKELEKNNRLQELKKRKLKRS